MRRANLETDYLLQVTSKVNTFPDRKAKKEVMEKNYDIIIDYILKFAEHMF